MWSKMDSIELSDDASIRFSSVYAGTCNLCMVVGEFTLVIEAGIETERAKIIASTFERYSDYVYAGKSIHGVSIFVCYDIYNEVWVLESQVGLDCPVLALERANMSLPTTVANSYYSAFTWVNKAGRTVTHNSQVGTMVDGLPTNKTIRELLNGDKNDIETAHRGIVFKFGSIYLRCVNYRLWQDIGDYTINPETGIVLAQVCEESIVTSVDNAASDCIASFFGETNNFDYFSEGRFHSLEMDSEDADIDYTIILSVDSNLMDLVVYKNGQSELLGRGAA